MSPRKRRIRETQKTESRQPFGRGNCPGEKIEIKAMGMAENSNVTGKSYKSGGNRAFNELVGESERSSGNAGVRPETHTAGLPGLFFGSSPTAGAE